MPREKIREVFVILLLILKVRVTTFYCTRLKNCIFQVATTGHVNRLKLIQENCLAALLKISAFTGNELWANRCCAHV